MCSSLEDKISQPCSELDKHYNELQTHQEQKSMLGTVRATSEESQTRDITSITSIEQKKKKIFKDSFLQVFNASDVDRVETF